jgi:hypothetical protein
MRFFRRRAAPERTLHPGIRLRISVPSGPLVEADSQHLYYVAKFGGEQSVCTPACLPGCDSHGWMCLIPGSEANFMTWAGDFGWVGDQDVKLRVEIKPVLLAADPYEEE